MRQVRTAVGRLADGSRQGEYVQGRLKLKKQRESERKTSR